MNGVDARLDSRCFSPCWLDPCLQCTGGAVASNSCSADALTDASARASTGACASSSTSVSATQPRLPASCTWAHPRVTLMTVTLVPGCSWAASSCTVVRMIPVPALLCLVHVLAMNARGLTRPVMLCRSALLRRSSTSPSVLLEKCVDVHLLHGVWARSHAATWCAVRLAIFVHAGCGFVVLRWWLLWCLSHARVDAWPTIFALGAAWCVGNSSSCCCWQCVGVVVGNGNGPWCWLVIRHDRSMLISAAWCVVARHGAAPLGHGHATGPSVGTACCSARTCARPIYRCVPLTRLFARVD